MQLDRRVVIIGGGLSGLTLAYLLKQKGVNALILEASSRLGGRIQTLKGKNETPLELGATWFSDIHPNLLSLIDELGLIKYPQFSKGISFFKTKSFEPAQQFFVPEAELPSYRIAGGTQALIDSLSAKLNSENIQLNTKVKAIKELDHEVLIETTNGKEFQADKVIVCIPPQLAISSIQYFPELGSDVNSIFSNVQTWMSGSIKFVLEYEENFWRKNGMSGMLYSHTGIVSEMYDHSNFEENKFGFTGFLSGAAANYSQELRKELLLQQLHELFGDKIMKPLAYFDKIWTDEYISGANQIIQRPHQNNGHKLLQNSYLGGKLCFSATETSSSYPGYMEGAVCAAKRILREIGGLIYSD
jgi:monoamine oxidase